uniref:RAP domain-containing protein n=1 Tax=Dunaliella tertiolecta TaxID=3047 RepID=A0A7S3VM75_DUNTE|mmetsp:Transcript_1151/g.2725  ORF Transcript_1151/g.2725 Transcript_1151/m.2725 type:complete len:542 (+) Transcript_1151:52-1677(+)
MVRRALLRACAALQQAAGPSAASGAAACTRSVPAFAQLARLQQEGGIGATQAWQRSQLSTSSLAQQAALTEVPVEGNAESLLKEIDAIITNEAATAKEVADAAVSLAYMQAKGNRRLWGKVFEKAGALKSSFDAPSLSNFMWAASTAGVGHFKTLFELSGPAASMIKTLTPTQLSIVVEALGKAGAKDVDFFGQVSSQVSSNMGAFKPSELSRILWGFAAAGIEDAAFVKAVAKALSDKARDLGGSEAVQAIWGLARSRTADKPALDALVNVAKSKLDSGVDAAALAWSLGYINYKPDAATAKAMASALQAAAPGLTPAHAIDAAWGLGVTGAGTKESVRALFSNVASAIDKAPDSLDPYQVAALYEAAAMTPEAPLPEQVAAFAAKMYALADEGTKSKLPSAVLAFKDELVEAAAYGMGARYRPEVAAARKKFAVVTPDGVAIDIAVSLDNNTKFAVEAVPFQQLSSANTPLGPAAARAKLLESKGYKGVLISAADWAGLADSKAKAKHLLAAVKKAVPAASSKVSGLMSAVDKPFDPYQ